MAKSKDRSETENLRGLLREQKAINRNLKREVARLQKQLGREEPEEIVLIEQPEYVEVDSKKCPKCASVLDAVDLGIKALITCTHCDYRFVKSKD